MSDDQTNPPVAVVTLSQARNGHWTVSVSRNGEQLTDRTPYPQAETALSFGQSMLHTLWVNNVEARAKAEVAGHAV